MAASVHPRPLCIRLAFARDLSHTIVAWASHAVHWLTVASITPHSLAHVLRIDLMSYGSTYQCTRHRWLNPLGSLTSHAQLVCNATPATTIPACKTLPHLGPAIPLSTLQPPPPPKPILLMVMPALVNAPHMQQHLHNIVDHLHELDLLFM